MRTVMWCFIFSLFLLLTACAKDPEMAKMEEFYKKYEDHCRTYARSMLAEYDEQVRYDECMTFFSNIDKNCPMDKFESYMKTGK